VKQLYFERFTPGFAKLKQSLIAVFALDALVSKDTQLQLFINTVYLGENEGQSVNGFTQGAEVYFGRRFEDLTRDEYLALVAMIIAPNTLQVRLHPEENAMRVERVKRLLAGQYRPRDCGTSITISQAPRSSPALPLAPSPE
jgi:membrane peptidoglycan carboxypeptidase